MWARGKNEEAISQIKNKEKNVNCDRDFKKKFGSIYENWKCDSIIQFLSLSENLAHIHREAIIKWSL